MIPNDFCIFPGEWLNRQTSTLSIHPIGGSQGELKSKSRSLEV